MSSVRSSGSRLLWLGVAYVVTDCLASVKLVQPGDLPDPSTSSSSSTGNSAGTGSSSSSSSRGASSGGSGGGPLAVFVDKASLRLFRFQRGELVLLKSPEEPRRRVLRRLVGLEGDFVCVAGGKTERVPKGNCWVEADSGLRAAGGDSRVSWGPVPLALVEGRVSHVLWPPVRWGRLASQPCPSCTRVVGMGGSLEFLHPPAEQDD